MAADRQTGYRLAESSLGETDVYEAKWKGFGAGCLLMISAGSIYAFALWSDGLEKMWPRATTDKAKEGNELYQAALVGVYLPFAGFFYHRFGPFQTLLAAAIMALVSYGGLLLQFFWSRTKHSPDFLTFAMFFLAGHSTGYLDSAVIGTALKYVSATERGAAMGLLKGYFGLSASILGLISGTGMSTSQFLFILGPFSAFVIFLLSFYLRPFDAPTEPNEQSSQLLRFGLGIQLAVAFSMFIRSMTPARSSHLIAVVMCIILIPLILCNMFLVQINRIFRRLTNPTHLNSEDSESGGRREENQEEATSDDGLLGSDEILREKSSMDLWDAAMTLEFWLLFLQLFVVMGGGLVLVGNAARIVKAKGGNDDDVNALVSVVSIANCVGRLAVGFIADHRITYSRGIYRPALLSIALVLMGFSHVWLALSSLGSCLSAGFLGGFAYGATWTLNPTILADVCGLKYFGKLYGIMGLAPTFGSFVFADLISSSVYAAHSHKDDTGTEICDGNACFGWTHWAIATSCICAALTLGPALILKTRPTYQLAFEH